MSVLRVKINDDDDDNERVKLPYHAVKSENKIA